MMPSLLDQLAGRRIHLEIDGTHIRYKAPAGAITPEIRDLIVINKTELIEFLSGRQKGEEESVVPDGERHFDATGRPSHGGEEPRRDPLLPPRELPPAIESGPYAGFYSTGNTCPDPALAETALGEAERYLRESEALRESLKAAGEDCVAIPIGPRTRTQCSRCRRATCADDVYMPVYGFCAECVRTGREAWARRPRPEPRREQGTRKKAAAKPNQASASLIDEALTLASGKKEAKK